MLILGCHRLLAMLGARRAAVSGGAFACSFWLLGALVALIAWAAPVRSADLFVSSPDSNSVVRFDGKTGKLISVFVPPGSGGLSGTHGLAFGLDGNLYVNNDLTQNVTRYDGHTGAFLGIFASGDLQHPSWLT